MSRPGLNNLFGLLNSYIEFLDEYGEDGYIYDSKFCDL